LHLTKLEVAKRQLETAVVLYFHESDPVSIHTLTAASYEVLGDLSKRAGQLPGLEATIREHVKPSRLGEIVQYL